MKRQRGRNRNGGGGGGGSGRPQHNANRAFDSNGPDGVKVRGAAQHVYERYQQFARDAHTAGDRVVAENYLQHAEHYFRVMRAMQPQRPVSEIVGRDQFVSGYDIDFEDEGGNLDASESDGEVTDAFAERPDRTEARQGERQDRFEPRQNERPREDRARDERPRDDRFQNDRQQRAFRYDRPRPDRVERRDEAPNLRLDQARPDNSSSGGGESAPLAAGRSSEPVSSMLRADDGEVSHAPAFLQVRPAEPREESSGEPRRPRRRRAPRSFEGGESSPTSAESGDS
ncbi:MAG TPA: DUF4167 domain-containing protein [Caulobacteraceae bacterium]